MQIREHHETEYLGHVGRLPQFRTVIRQRPIAHLENGWYVRNVDDWQSGGPIPLPHIVTRSSMIVTAGNASRRRIHPTRELDRWIEIGAPYVKVGGTWTQINLGTPVRTGNLLQWTKPQANLYLRMIGHAVKFGVLLKGGWVPEDSKIAWPVGAVGLSRSGAIIKRDGVPVARLRPAHVEDMDNPVDIRPVTTQFVRISGTWHAVMTLPDLSGMDKPLLDPTLQLQPGASGEDLHIASNNPTTNYSTVDNLSIGNFAGVPATLRGLIKFDLSSLPDSAAISSTTLSLYFHSDQSNNARTMRVYRLKREWVLAQATWNSWKTGSNWATAGGFGAADCEQSDIGNRAYPASPTLNEFKDFSLTATQKTDLDYGLENAGNATGWLIKVDTEAGDAYAHYASDYATAANRPKLVIEYTAGDTSAKLKHMVG